MAISEKLGNLLDRVKPSATKQGESGAEAGRVALVTGAGRGLGEAIARVLDIAGAIVIAADVKGDLARSCRGKIRSAKRPRAVADAGRRG